MSSVFAVADSPCGVFAPVPGLGTQQLLSFQRAAHLLEGRAITINSAGETVLSYVPLQVVSMDLQPQPAKYLRLLQGALYEVAFVGILWNNPDLLPGDRCTISGYQVEVISTQHYGQEHTECEMRWIGR